MSHILKTTLVKALKSIISALEDDTIHCSDTEALEALKMLEKFNTGRPLSKEQACQYMNLSRSTFDTYIRNGWIPKGKKVSGFKELSWSLSDLAVAKDKIKDITQ